MLMSPKHVAVGSVSRLRGRGSVVVLVGLAFLGLVVAADLARAVVTPASDRAFCQHPNTGSDIVRQMAAEATNPLLSNLVVHFVNLNPVTLAKVQTNSLGVVETNDLVFEQWTGTLISPEWVLTCAHTVQGLDGLGLGVDPADVFYNFGGTSFADPGQAAVAEIHINPGWSLEGYSAGGDVALIRLATPVTGIAEFPRLDVTPFLRDYPVVFAGYGLQGDGLSGGTTGPGLFGVGINTLDRKGGAAMADGFGNSHSAYAAYPASVAFMDFDQWERRDVACGAQHLFPEFALAAYSTMGVENVLTSPVADPCGGGGLLPDAFLTRYCDFFPAPGDSGGPVFLASTLPNIPGQGFYLNAPATLIGVASFILKGNQAVGGGIYGNVAGYTLVQEHLDWIYRTARPVAERDTDGDGRNDEAEIQAGSDPYSPPHAPSTYVPSPLDVILQGLRILGERAFGADMTDLEFTGDLRNADSGRYFDLSVNVDRTRLPIGAEVVDPMLNFSSLSENGTATAGAGQSLVVRVANADVPAARAAILSGDWLKVSAFEEQVYAYPTRFVDAPTDDAFTNRTVVNGEFVLIFATPTDLLNQLQPGEVLIAETTRTGYHPKSRPVGYPSLSQFLPFKVTAVATANGLVQVTGDIADLDEILKSGTFLGSDENFNGSGRDLLDPPVENTHTSAEKAERALNADLLGKLDPDHPGLADLLGMDAIPWRFNDVQITPALRLSGQVLLRSSGLRVQLAYRDFTLKRASVGIDAGVTASMVLETAGAANNQGAPLAEKQKQLARIPLPPVPMTIAGVPVSINPAFVVSVGAEVNAPSGLSIPVETSVRLGTEVGWSDGQTFLTPIKEFTAPHVSDPTVFEAVAAEARAWAEAKIEVNVGVAAGAISTGPSLAIRAKAEFAVQPLANPWWTLDGNADLVAGFQLSMLGLDVAYTETSQNVGTFFHRDAGGPLPSGAGGSAGSAGGAGGGGGAPVDIGPQSAKDVRWALAFAPPNGSGNYNKGFVTPLSGGGTIVGGGNAISTFLGKVSSEGRIEWMLTFPLGGLPIAGAQLPDGRVLVAGMLGLDWWLAQFDLLGNRLWTRSYRTQADLRSLAVAISANGTPELYLAGFQDVALVTQSNPLVLKLSATGDVIWEKIYTLNGDDEVHSIRALRDGNLLLTGFTDARVGTDPIIGSRGNGLVMKITPAGSILWATAVPGYWGVGFRDSAEGPDGSLYAVGSHGDIIFDLYPSILVAKFTADGQLIHHVSLGEDGERDNVLPDSGDTPYDYAAQCVWAGDSLVVAGTTGLGAGQSGWVSRLTDELGVRWMSAFDGPAGAYLLNLAATDKGVLAMGAIDNPWPSKFTNRTPAWLLSLPWEGVMRFHPTSRVRSGYLQPRVFLSSEDSDFIGRFADAAGRSYRVPTAQVPFGLSNAVPAAGTTLQPGVLTAFTTARLDRYEPSVISNYDEWLAYYQLSGTNAAPGADLDGDGVRNLWEFFAGGDPLTASTNTPVGLSIRYDHESHQVTIEFARSVMATGQAFHLIYSTDLQRWFPVNGVTQQIIATDATLQWIRLTLIEPHIYQAFFRLELP